MQCLYIPFAASMDHFFGMSHHAWAAKNMVGLDTMSGSVRLHVHVRIPEHTSVRTPALLSMLAGA